MLRSSLHPLIAVLFYQGITADFLPALLELALDQRDTWAPHAYVINASWSVQQNPRLQSLIAQLGIPVIPLPSTVQQLLTCLEGAAARIGAV